MNLDKKTQTISGFKNKNKEIGVMNLTSIDDTRSGRFHESKEIALYKIIILI